MVLVTQKNLCPTQIYRSSDTCRTQKNLCPTQIFRHRYFSARLGRTGSIRATIARAPASTSVLERRGRVTPGGGGAGFLVHFYMTLYLVFENKIKSAQIEICADFPTQIGHSEYENQKQCLDICVDRKSVYATEIGVREPAY